MRNSTSITLGLALAGLGLVFTGAASAGPPMHYLGSTGGVAVASDGTCWRDSYWTEANAIEECDPNLIKREVAVVETAAMETTTVLSKKEVTLSAGTLFGFDSAELTMDGMKTLDGVAASAAEVPNQTIRITGHTDRIGSMEHNKQLSMLRAQAVQEYLSAKGLSAGNMAVAGVGSEEPVVGCEGKRGQMLVDCLAPNRRTEVEFSAIEVMEQ